MTFSEMREGSLAFPVDANAVRSGMTLRDYFAGQALVGYLADGQAPLFPSGAKDEVARECYEIADAMIAEKWKLEAAE